MIPESSWMEENGAPVAVTAFWVFFFVYHREKVLPLLRETMFWFFSSLLLYWFILSGTHWNMIRGAPLIAISQTGNPQLFLGGIAQTVVEGWIMATLCGGLAWIGLAVWVPTETDLIKRVLQFSVFAVAWAMSFSWVVLLYTMTKHPRYGPLSYAFSGD